MKHVSNPEYKNRTPVYVRLILQAIDRLARNGVVFCRAFAMPKCSPTRAALLTGSSVSCHQVAIGCIIMAFSSMI